MVQSNGPRALLAFRFFIGWSRVLADPYKVVSGGPSSVDKFFVLLMSRKSKINLKHQGNAAASAAVSIRRADFYDFMASSTETSWPQLKSVLHFSITDELTFLILYR